MIYKVYKVSTPKIPLKAYCDLNAFKIYFLDVGLLSCMSGLKSDTLTSGSDIFVEFKGILAEQYVLQEIKNVIHYPDGFYYANKTSTSEVDFLLHNQDGIIPIEVKAGINLKAKSLKAYMEKFRPPYVIKLSLEAYNKTEKIINVPLYNVRNVI